MASTYYTINPYSPKHVLLTLLSAAQAGLREPELFEGLSSARPTAKRRFMETNHLKPMVAREAVTHEDGIYLITPVGRRVLFRLDQEAGGKNIAKPDTLNRMVGVYTCPELRRTSPRPGSQDAYNLPSVINGKLQNPKHVQTTTR